MKILIISLFLMLSMSNLDDADILAALGRAEVYAEKASDLYKGMYDYLRKEYDASKTDIDKRAWEYDVKPFEKKARMFMGMAREELASIIPEELKSDLWKRIRNEVYAPWDIVANHLKDMDFYQSEYMLHLAGYPSYLYMYLAITSGKIKELDKANQALEDIRQEVARKQRQLLPGTSSENCQVTFEYIPIGSGYHEFLKKLKGKGFKVITQRESDIHGNCTECFLEGEFHGNPAVIQIIASCRTRTVFRVNVRIHGLMDEEEAVEEGEYLTKEELAKYDYSKTMDFSTSGSARFVELPDRQNRSIRYFCLPIVSVATGLYENKTKKVLDEPFGSITSTVYYNTLKQEYIEELRYYDQAVETLARREAEKDIER